MKNKNIHILPTDKPSRLVTINENLYFDKKEREMMSAEFLNIEAKNIYITSDEEIKEGDWYFDGTDLVHKKTKYNDALVDGNKNAKKIILTTDGDLIKDGVQAIDDEFLEWFVNNQSCDEVEIADLWKEGTPSAHDSYQIIIPKEEQTDMMKADDEEPKKDYSGLHLRHCYQGKHKDGCKYGKDDCPAKPKQETLEEAAEKYSKRSSASVFQEAHKIDFIEGAKWQQDQDKNKYSEEDMIEAAKYGYNFHKTTSFPSQEFEASCIRNTQQWLTTLKK